MTTLRSKQQKAAIDKTWKSKPKVVLRTPTKRSNPGGGGTGQDSRISLDRTVYRNALVHHLSHLCDQITMDTFKVLNLQFLHLKDQIYGLTVGQLEELIHALAILAACQHTMTYAVSKLMHKRHRELLKRLKKGLVLE